MTTPEQIIAKQAEHIEVLKKAIQMLESRVRRLETTERSIKANLTTNARDIRNVGVSVQNLEARLQRG